MKLAEETTDEELGTFLVHTGAIMAYVHRLCENLQRKVRKEPQVTRALTQHEIAQVELTIFRMVQSEQYPDGLAMLSDELIEKEGLKERQTGANEQNPNVVAVQKFRCYL